MMPPGYRLPPIIHRPVVLEWLAAPLPAQLHASRVPWDGVLVERPKEVLVGSWFKPKFGLWTSSERADGESAWLDLCRDPAQEECTAVEVHRYEVIGTPRIWVLRTDAQLIETAIMLGLLAEMRDDPELWARPGWEEPEEAVWDVERQIMDRMDVLLKCDEFWGTLPRHADAVHVPADADFSGEWVGAFDVESTCWFRPESHMAHRGKRGWAG
jgi:hypothetical protein